MTDPGQVPVVALGVRPDPEASSVGVPPGQRSVDVITGGGAYVLSGGWADTDDGSPFIIDSNGASNPLVGPEAADKLGFGDFPRPWCPTPGSSSSTGV